MTDNPPIPIPAIRAPPTPFFQTQNLIFSPLNAVTQFTSTAAPAVMFQLSPGG